MRVENGFQPIPFTEGHPFLEDPVLPSLLKRILPVQLHEKVQTDLIRFGTEVETTIRDASTLASPPTLTQYDHWGRRIDQLHTSEGWRTLKAICQREGIPGMFYERTYAEYSRVWGFVKVLLMCGDSVVIFCPMSMTDGCARAIELHGTPGMRKDVLPRLISRDPYIAFTSGQWMTERPGGSDLSQTETTASALQASELGPAYTLDGFKWFSSATDSDISVALARTGSPNGGSRSLSLFLVPLHLPLLSAPKSSSTMTKPSSTSNGIYIHRLKNKIGTHALPTAELSLNATTAYLLGPLGEGVKCITPVLTITRIYSTLGSIGNLRKCLAIATAYAHVRSVGGQLLKDKPLHVAQLASISVTYRALTHFAFGVVLLLGRVECGVAREEEHQRLRMLTPVIKAFAAELAVGAMEAAMAALGGQGYMEENMIGRAIRDGLVEKIWEGTTTVLALDLVRATKDASTMVAFLSWCDRTISAVPNTLRTALYPALQVLKSGTDSLRRLRLGTEQSPLVPRPALMLVGYVASGVYLLEHALWEGSEDIDVEVFSRWMIDGGLKSTVEEVERAKGDVQQRIKKDISIAKL